MGIPSYYRTLCNTVPGLVLSQLPKGTRIQQLWLDFNCLIYHCVRNPRMPPYPGEEGRVAWESELLKVVCSYVRSLIEIVKPESYVYCAVDGVVPMAKMKQQRKRRFKSAWMSAKEWSVGKPCTETWDTNSITPGTEFMDRLESALKEFAKGQPVPVVVSSSNEPGEGEQKIFQMLRGQKTDQEIVIYGLDADLILLSLQYQKTIRSPVWLFREATEFERASGNTQEYRFLHIPTLLRVVDEKHIEDYCASMALLGNDFLPHSLWFSISEGGHDLLQEILEGVHERGEVLVQDGRWVPSSLVSLLENLAHREEVGFKHLCRKKGKMYVRPSQATEAWQQEMDRWNQRPVEEKAERCFLWADPDILHPKWREIYYEILFGAKTQEDVDAICRSYAEGLVWSQAYLNGGQTLSETWFYPWSYPPLWNDVADWIRENGLPTLEYKPIHLEPQEQLAMVLPFSSYWLVRKKHLRRIPYEAQDYFPRDLVFCTLGKKKMWECDPWIPILTPSRLRLLKGS